MHYPEYEVSKDHVSEIRGNSYESFLAHIAREERDEVYRYHGYSWPRHELVEIDHSLPPVQKLCVKLAHAGDPVAQSNFGTMYYHGLGVEEDKNIAAEWYKKASEKGMMAASYNLGMMYANGDGVQTSKRLARKFLSKASKLGHSDAKKAYENL